MAASYICNRIPHSAVNMEMPYKKLDVKDADLSHLKTVDARAFVHIKNPNMLSHTSWKRIVYGFSETESNSYRVTWWREGTSFSSTPPNLLFVARQLPPQQDLESPPYDFSDYTLDDNYVSHEEMLRDVQNAPLLWISASTHLPERYNFFCLNKPHPA